MAYSSRGRRPLERASKISHSEIINNDAVRSYISRCTLPQASPKHTLDSELHLFGSSPCDEIKAVIAIDGGFTEAPVRKDYPFASIAFYTFGPLLFELKHLRELDEQLFIDPEDIQRLKRLQRYSFVLPLRGIKLMGEQTLASTVRKSIFEFFIKARGDQESPLIESLRWLLFRQWQSPSDPTHEITIAWCPNPSCDNRDIAFHRDTPVKVSCTECAQEIFLTDVFRFDERVDDEQGAGAIVAYVMSVLEQIVLVDTIRSILSLKPTLLREILFIKDGPLAFFGVVAPLYLPMRELCAHLTASYNAGGPFLRLVGVEKSGAFVEHADAIRDSMQAGSFLICNNDYIYQYIIPGDPMVSLYGSNTYYGQKIIMKATTGEMYVLTIPTRDYQADPTPEDFPRLLDTLSVINELRCSMYDDSLLPIALVNKLVSLSDFPSQRLLTSFAKGSLGTS